MALFGKGLKPRPAGGGFGGDMPVPRTPPNPAQRGGGGASPIPQRLGNLSGVFRHLNYGPLHMNSTRGSKPFTKAEIMQGHRKMAGALGVASVEKSMQSDAGDS